MTVATVVLGLVPKEGPLLEAGVTKYGRAATLGTVSQQAGCLHYWHKPR
jgi:hypothetical protein